MPKKGCMPSPGHYTCGANATDNLYHDFEQTPHGDCGKGIECGEYVFNHRNASLRPVLRTIPYSSIAFHARRDRVVSLSPCRLYCATMRRAPPPGLGVRLTLPCGWKNTGRG